MVDSRLCLNVSNIGLVCVSCLLLGPEMVACAGESRDKREFNHACSQTCVVLDEDRSPASVNKFWRVDLMRAQIAGLGKREVKC